MQWLDTVEVSTQPCVLESVLVGKRGTVQVRLHCTEKGKDVQKLEILTPPPPRAIMRFSNTCDQPHSDQS